MGIIHLERYLGAVEDIPTDMDTPSVDMQSSHLVGSVCIDLG